MKALQAAATIIDIDFGKNPLKKIELVGRTCYKSEDKITDDSAEKFVSNLIKSGHEAMLEHASFCFEIDYGVHRAMQDTINSLSDYYGFKSFIRFTNGERSLMSGNVRAWRDLFHHMIEYVGIPDCFEPFIKQNPILFPELQDEMFIVGNIGCVRPVHICDLKNEDEFLTHCDITVKFIVDRGVSHELVRHRVASFAQESTRYCNYGKDKFGKQLTFIIPEFFKFGSEEWHLWKTQMESVEKLYIEMIERGVSPQEARTVLPNSLKTEIVMTANAAEWIHFFELRACNKTGKAHPQMLEVTRPLLDEFKETVAVIFDGLSYEE